MPRAYFPTAASGAIAAIAILCPRGTRSRAVVPATAVPGATASTATTTLVVGGEADGAGIVRDVPDIRCACVARERRAWDAAPVAATRRLD